MIVRSDIFNNTYSGSACRKVPDIVVPIGRLSILEHFDWIIEICSTLDFGLSSRQIIRKS